VSDGDLRLLFRKRFSDWQWSPIESGSTTLGLPDSEFCAPGGVAGWLEFKLTHAHAVKFRPLQTHWLETRAGLGGRCAVAVRRRPTAKQYAGVDELWLVAGRDAPRLEAEGISAAVGLCVGARGPASWNWAVVEEFLRR
jgi:hypothetical protein